MRDVIRNFNADGFGSLYPRYKGGHPPKFTLGQRREIKKIAKSRPVDHGLPFSTWSLAKLADFLVAAGVVDDISHEGLRALLGEECVTFQRSKTWKASNDPRYQAKKGRSPCHGGSQTLVRASPPPTAHVTERRVWHLEWPQLGSFSEPGHEGWHSLGRMVGT